MLNNTFTDQLQESRKRINLVNSYKTIKFEDLVNNYEKPVLIILNDFSHIKLIYVFTE